MSKLIPQDIESFLYKLGTLEEGTPSAIEQCAKIAATLLWEKYVIFEDRSIQVLPASSIQAPAGGRHGAIEDCISNVHSNAPEAQSSLAPRFSVGKRDSTSSFRSPVGTAQGHCSCRNQ